MCIEWIYQNTANWLSHNKYSDFAVTWNFPVREGCRTLPAWLKPPGSVRRSNVWQRGWASSRLSQRLATELWGNTPPHTAHPKKHNKSLNFIVIRFSYDQFKKSTFKHFAAVNLNDTKCSRKLKTASLSLCCLSFSYPLLKKQHCHTHRDLHQVDLGLFHKFRQHILPIATHWCRGQLLQHKLKLHLINKLNKKKDC